MVIEALNGRVIDLRGVTDIIDSETGDTRGRSISVRADGSDSVVNLSNLRNFNVTTSETNNGVILGNYGLRVSALPPADSSGREIPSLESDVLITVVDVAIDWWARAGVPEAVVAALKNNLEFRIIDLPGTYLGHVSGNIVWIDSDAAGFGWFVDLTPSDHVEFDEMGTAKSGSDADGRIDLLTVVLHELGHSLGLGHSDDPGTLMYEFLDSGQRRKISTEDIDSLFLVNGWDR